LNFIQNAKNHLTKIRILLTKNYIVSILYLFFVTNPQRARGEESGM